MKALTHLDAEGGARMVDVGSKSVSRRTAIARGEVRMRPEVLRLIADGEVPKGDVVGAARIAGIMAAKKTAEIIPLCHALNLDSVSLTFESEAGRLGVEATVRTQGRTGAEMEALTAVSAACLTIYDMAKAVDKEMVIGPIYLVEKEGGRSGHYVRRGRP